MQKRRGLRDRLVSLLELPGDVLLDVARVTLVGDVELVVENHRGIVQYTEDRVGLSIPEGTLTVEGEELRIAAISPEQVIILGRIRSLRYTPPDGASSGGVSPGRASSGRASSGGTSSGGASLGGASFGGAPPTGGAG